MILLALTAKAGFVLAEPADATVQADWQMTLRARSALWDDPTFEKMNLGVRVRQGVATLHGPVPSTAVAEQALERLRKLEGLRGVVNETYVPPADEPVARSMPRPVMTQRSPMPYVPAVPTAPAAPPDDPKPPRPIPAAAPAPTPGQPAGVVLPPVTAPSGTMTVGERIDRLRQRDRRFQDIRFEVRNGRVTLFGTAARAQDAWEFSQLVSRIPGVTGVTNRID